jgi:hypothetical protein
MKNSRFSILLLAIFAFALTSCSTCVDCGDCPEGITLTDANGADATSVEICEDDADSKEEYDDAIAIIEALGCECK